MTRREAAYYKLCRVENENNELRNYMNELRERRSRINDRFMGDYEYSGELLSKQVRELERLYAKSKIKIAKNDSIMHRIMRKYNITMCMIKGD